MSIPGQFGASSGLTAPPRLQDVIDWCGAAGLRVNNLCQLDDGSWRANVTNGQACWEFGAASAAEGPGLALARAYMNVCGKLGQVPAMQQRNASAPANCNSSAEDLGL